jgi:hypothetical protein
MRHALDDIGAAGLDSRQHEQGVVRAALGVRAVVPGLVTGQEYFLAQPLVPLISTCSRAPLMSAQSRSYPSFCAPTRFTVQPSRRR